ncbi:two-component sensor histidine kinase [Rhodopseudomonas rhenobacensis]|uniref:histidine kinase n=1 Tax=Rhodopseudomonas rhenobacensis TaxID=87461 RepID=A0A7W7Z937_9BRAD|nr:histidine kinase dimerization/phosphoacceptor domain -containing protein [Rhodopseudomonas rhenobacensis]MBB5049767.1 two-component sensor histidine kinase [Rhodopseudomonas rhenobacensis]
MPESTEKAAFFPIYLQPGAGRDELPYRLRQQSLLGDFGRAALQTRELDQLLQRAAELCADGLRTRFAQVLEFVPGENRLVGRAGVGWEPDRIADMAFETDVGSPAGYAYKTRQPVITNQLPSEARFKTPQLFTDHGVIRSINVLIERGGEGQDYFGVLEVASADPGWFDQADADFLAAFAGLLGIAIERQQADARLADALEHQSLLTREMSHRVKNSLASVVGLLRVQSRGAQSDEVRAALQEASSRVDTIAQVHDNLARGSRIGFIDFADFIDDFCGRLQANANGNQLRCRAEPMLLLADHGIPLGLLINELVTNAIKHAYPDRCGVIELSACALGDRLHVEVADQGVGLPDGFDINAPRSSLGFKVIRGLVRQLRGRLQLLANNPGARFLIDLPIVPAADPPSAAAR